MIAATRHDEFADLDYERLRSVGIGAARDGLRWHLIEYAPRRYDFASAIAQLRAARRADVQVVWDLCHYGWPDDADPFSESFIERFADFASACAQIVADETDGVPFYTPLNEVGYLAWAGGDVGYLNPFAHGRGLELKMQLVRALLAAIKAIRSVDARARIATIEPRTHLVTQTTFDERVLRHRDWEYEAWDMLSGRRWPELGGDVRYLDLIGVNYYPTNQFRVDDTRIGRDSDLYRPFREILLEVGERYGRPIFVGETSAPLDDRPEWLAYIGSEARAARSAGASVEAICLYPIVDHPHWDAGYPLEAGVWSYADDAGRRQIHVPYSQRVAAELKDWDALGHDVGTPSPRTQPLLTTSRANH